MTFALCFCNRSFMTGELVYGARENMVKAVTDAGYDYIMMDASPALTEWTVKNEAKCGGPKTEQKLIDEGYLTASSKIGDKTSLQYFTTTARQKIICGEMKKIVRGCRDLWCI